MLKLGFVCEPYGGYFVSNNIRFPCILYEFSISLIWWIVPGNLYENTVPFSSLQDCYKCLYTLIYPARIETRHISNISHTHHMFVMNTIALLLPNANTNITTHCDCYTLSGVR